MTDVVDVIDLDRQNQVTAESGRQGRSVVKIGLLFVDVGTMVSSPWWTAKMAEIEDRRSISEHALCTVGGGCVGDKVVATSLQTQEIALVHVRGATLRGTIRKS